MKRQFRKYHRFLAPILALPLLLTALTGIAVTLIREWSINLGVLPSLLLKIHTGELFGLEAIYPVLNGIGLVGLLLTGLSLTGLFSRNNRHVTKP